MKQALLILFSALFSCCANADDWSYFESVTGYDGQWTITEGRAEVTIHDKTIEINIYKKAEVEGAGNETTETRELNAETITGKIDEQGNIVGTETINFSDAAPIRITGHFYSDKAKQGAGDKSVDVVYEKIVVNNSYRVVGLVRKHFL